MMFGIGKKKRNLDVDDILPAFEPNFDISNLESYNYDDIKNIVKFYEGYIKKTT